MEINTASQPVAHIYALIDPRETDNVKRVRYIGKTKNLGRRFRHHLQDAKTGIRTHCYNWIRQLLAVGLAPMMGTLETTTQVDAADRERAWIAYLRAAGSPLTNLTNGGDGIPGHHHSEETREKMSTVHLGKKLSSETRTKISEANTGKKRSPEIRAKFRASAMGNKNCLGRSVSDECRMKIATALKGYRHSEETRARMSVAHTGTKHSAMTRLRMSLGQRQSWTARKGEQGIPSQTEKGEKRD